MKNMQSAKGYVLILALSMLSLIMVLISGLINRATPFFFFDATVIKREKAKQLALSGLQIAMSQLAANVAPPEEQKPGTAAQAPKSSQDQERIKLFKSLVPALNSWQRFGLSDTLDGVKGAIDICISCEQGKLNINELFDFKTKKFVGEGKAQGDMRKVMQSVFTKLTPYTKDKNLFGVFEKFLKTRHSKLHEVTELLRIKEFQEVFAQRQFYEPPSLSKEAIKGKKQAVGLTDLFTIWSQEQTVSAWVLSDALCAVFGFNRISQEEIKVRKQAVDQAVEQKAFTVASLDAAWPKGLQALTGKELGAVPQDLKAMLSASFEPDVFSVISRGTVGNISQKIFAIIERREPEGDRSTAFVIKRLYVL